MKTIKAIKPFEYNNRYYSEGDIVDIRDIKVIAKLNELGFIEPLSTKDLQNLKYEIANPRKIRSEEE